MTGLWRQAASRLLAFFRKSSADRELRAELEAHLHLAMDENLQRGLSPEEARRLALVRIGGIARAQELHREVRGLPLLDVLWQDVRYASRTLLRDRAYALISILILALGIGANIAVFSVVNTILLRPLPFQDPRQLAWIAGNHEAGGLSFVTYPVAVYEEFQRHNRSFQDVTSYNPFLGNSDYKLLSAGEPQQVAGVMVAENFFSTLGVRPALGRLFLPEECRKGGRPAVLLSHFFWQRQFASNAAIVGKAITLSNKSVTVVGVLPEAFDFGSVFSPGLKIDVYVPALLDEMRDWGNTLALLGRLKPATTAAQAQTEADILLPQLRAAHREWFMDYSATITDLKQYVSGKLRRSLIVLWCAVGLILLIVCVNLSNLLLARASARRKEFAVRSALGAGRARLVRQLLTETFVLTGMGALAGLAFAFGITSYLARQGSIALPLLSSIRVDGAALVWTLLVAAVAALLFGLAPSVDISTGNLQEALKAAGHGISTGRRHDRVRSALVVSEVALACVLLAGAGLLLRSFLRVLDVDLGFQPSHAAAMKVDYDDGGKPARRGAVLQEMLRRVESIPGIESAGISDMLPLDRDRSWRLQAQGRSYRQDELSIQAVFVYNVTPGYLPTMGIHLREGRDFNWSDTSAREPVVIINRSAARLHWPGQDPLGRMALVNERETRVVGILDDVRERSVESGSGPEMYLPIMQSDPEGAELVVRSQLPPHALASGLLRTLRANNPQQPAAELRPLQQLVDHAVSPRRFFAMLVSAFAALGLILASLGIYGVISYSVSRQTQEIGIRMALGASAKRVQAGVMASTLRLGLAGIALGTVASFAIARWISSLLFETNPFDPATFVTIGMLLSLVAMVAGYIPARRASRVDPILTLRGN